MRLEGMHYEPFARRRLHALMMLHRIAGVDFPDYTGPEAAALQAKFASLVRPGRTVAASKRLRSHHRRHAASVSAVSALETTQGRFSTPSF